MASKRKSRSTSSTGLGPLPDKTLHEGWCVKESGTALFGKTNWRRRWFRLKVTDRNTVSLQYFRTRSDMSPAGSFKLDVTYCTRQVENHEKSQPNCFAVGPLIDDGATRTYYISCRSQLEMQEWMAVIDAVIQGVPEQAQRRRKTINHQFSLREKNRELERRATAPALVTRSNSLGDSLDERGLDLTTSFATASSDSQNPGASVDSTLVRDELSDDEVWEAVEDEVNENEASSSAQISSSASSASSSARAYRALSPDSRLRPDARLTLYDNPVWRMDRWKELVHTVKGAPWSKMDTKDGVTVARCKFGSGARGHAVIKVEGLLPAEPSTVFQFLQISTREGGKLDYLFRNELFLQEITEEPRGTIIFNEFEVPLPRVSKRDVVAMKLWVPEFLNRDHSSGFLMFSVDHPESPILAKDARRINVEPSGIVLSPYGGPDGELLTHATIVLRVAFLGALHRMLKGAYNSGLLKLGLRTTFTHMAEQLEKFVEVTDI